MGQPKKAELQVNNSNRTNQIVAMDLAGSFKTTVRGNKYVMLINDTHSKVLAGHAINGKETTTVTNKLLEAWFLAYGDIYIGVKQFI